MHSSNAGYHRLGRAAGTVNCHHSGKPRPAQPPDRIQTESRVFPDAGAHTRFSELHDHRSDAADEKGERGVDNAATRTLKLTLEPVGRDGLGEVIISHVRLERAWRKGKRASFAEGF